MKSTVTKTLTNGSIITVTVTKSTFSETVADGWMEKETEVLLEDATIDTASGDHYIIYLGSMHISRDHPDCPVVGGHRMGISGLPANAYGGIQGAKLDAKGRSTAKGMMPLSEETFKAISEAHKEALEGIATAKKDAADETDMIINPEYAHMTRDEIKAAERNFDDINNEGADGYNPYRDNLWVPKA